MPLDPLTAGIDLVTAAVKRIWPDATEAEQLKLEALKLAMAADLAQIQVNQAEAGNSSPVVAGWRPAVGWVCALSLAWVYLIHPLATSVAVGFGHAALPQPVDLADLWPLVMGMLGMGGLRSFDKTKGTAR